MLVAAEKKNGRSRWKRSEMGVTRRMAIKSIYEDYIRTRREYSIGKIQAYNPNGCKQQAELYPSELGIDASDDDCPVKLGSDTDTNDTEVHKRERPQAPVNQNPR